LREGGKRQCGGDARTRRSYQEFATPHVPGHLAL
jgi:hypothetical protein